MTISSPVLQVALDTHNLHRALQIARESVEGGVDWLEAGTPLIKSAGMEAVRELKKLFPSKKLVADLKILDVGGYETEIAAKAGADIVTIMGVSDDPTFKEALLAGEKYGVEIMADMLGVEDKKTRAAQLEEMGVHYLCVHVSIDSQMTGGSPCGEIRELAEVVNIPIAAAGGLNSESAPGSLEAGASIVIVGGAITKSPDVAGATSTIRETMLTGQGVKTTLFRRYGEDRIREALLKVSAPNVADAMHKKGAMVGLRPLRHGYKMVGQAFTVRTADGDWAKTVEAIDEAGEGDIIVIDAGKGHIAVWGELASWSCRTKGVAGVVIDGAIRDVDDIIEMEDFCAYARHTAPNAGEPKGFGELGTGIVCGGIDVRPGDWLIGDDSGIVVIPRERAAEIANRALDVKERENRLREEIKRGSTLSKVLELKEWEKVG
jgi:3-hexulose-6-phosphate synthase/6-phospho-3-hexuloisomerase